MHSGLDCIHDESDTWHCSVDYRLRDPDGDDEPINVGAALEEPDIESSSSGRSNDESAEKCEDDDDDD